METKKSLEREIYISGDPVVEAYRKKLLEAWNSPEDIESLFAKREQDIENIGTYDSQRDDIAEKVRKWLWI